MLGIHYKFMMFYDNQEDDAIEQMEFDFELGHFLRSRFIPKVNFTKLSIITCVNRALLSGGI